MTRTIVLDIPFDTVNEYDALKRILQFFRDNGKKHFIATPNPEMLLAARKDMGFRRILNSTDLNIADGTGILWASTYLHKTKNIKSRTLKILIGIKYMIYTAILPSATKKILPERVTGTDMMEIICKNIGGENKVYLLGGTAGVADKTAEILKKKYGNSIAGTSDSAGDTEHEDAIVKHINETAPEILFVAFGTPKQELWISRNLPKMKSVKVAIGVGGAFDFISGNVKRAPRLMRRWGLEWLYRLIKQPSRIKRIINATIVFPFEVIRSSL